MKNPGCLLETETEIFFEVWAAGLIPYPAPDVMCAVLLFSKKPKSFPTKTDVGKDQGMFWIFWQRELLPTQP